MVNKCLLHYCHRQLKLANILEQLKSVYLCGKGDFVSAFMDAVFNYDWLQTAKESSVSFLNSLVASLLGNTRFRFRPTEKGKQVETNVNFFYNLSNVSILP